MFSERNTSRQCSWLWARSGLCICTCSGKCVFFFKTKKSLLGKFLIMFCLAFSVENAISLISKWSEKRGVLELLFLITSRNFDKLYAWYWILKSYYICCGIIYNINVEGSTIRMKYLKSFYFILWRKEWSLGAILAAVTVNWLFRIQRQIAGFWPSQGFAWKNLMEHNPWVWAELLTQPWTSPVPSYWNVELGSNFRLQRLCLGKLLVHCWNLIGRWSN